MPKRSNSWIKAYFDPDFYNPASEAAVEHAPAEAQFIIAAAGLKSGMEVLDVACGPGRHSIELSKRGLSVTGVDCTKGYLAEARAKAAKARVDIDFILGDMRAMPFRNRFDAVVCMFTSFGYFTPEAENDRVLRNMCAALKPGGKLLLDLVDREVLEQTPHRRDWHENDDGGFTLYDEGIDPHTGLVGNTIIRVYPDGSAAERSYVVKTYNQAELFLKLRKAGLKPLKRWDRLSLKKTPGRGNRLVVLAVKEEK